MPVAIEIDASQMRKLYHSLGQIKDGVPRALSSAINRALNKGRTEIKREIRKEYLIKAKDIPVRVHGASMSRLGGAITIQDGMLDLNKFKVQPKGVQHRKNKKIVFAQVKRSGGHAMPGAFVAAVQSGYTGPFIRRGKSRLPIRKLITIGAPIMATQPSVGPQAIKAMGDALAKAIDQQIKRLMVKGGGH